MNGYQKWRRVWIGLGLALSSLGAIVAIAASIVLGVVILIAGMCVLASALNDVDTERLGK